MTCESVREHLADYLLGALPETTELDIRRHLRGCGQCRAELRSLEDGLTTFAGAAHQVDPPPALRGRVLEALREEKTETPTPVKRRWISVTHVAVAAAVVLLAGSLAWGAVASQRASHWHGEARKYEGFLDALGGKAVRVGTLRAHGSQPVEGSVVMYDSEVGQSWVLVLVRAPGAEGKARVRVSSPSRQIKLFPIQFDRTGEGSSWLVTGADLSHFDRVRIWDASGHLLASGRVSRL